MNLFEKAKKTSNLKHTCLYCKKTFSPDQRNVNRGWGLFCSKSCSASWKSKISSMKPSDVKIETRERKLKQLGI